MNKRGLYRSNNFQPGVEQANRINYQEVHQGTKSNWNFVFFKRF